MKKSTIDDINVVRNEVTALQEFRDNKKAKADWQSTTEDARVNFFAL